VTKKRHQSIISLSLPRVVSIVILTLVAILVIDFGRKALDSYHVQRQVEFLREKVAAEEEENEALLERLAYVSSDAYVEKIARETLKMVRPGDTAVVVVPGSTEQHSDDTTPMPATEGAEQEAKPHWQQWWDLFFEAGP
jgi:cell division protein FtsB